jgi:subtilisin family serine protease
MRVIVISLIFLLSQIVLAKQIKVAIIDTGISKTMLNSPILCKTGHKSFADDSIVDNSNHGTHISSLIDQNAKNFFIGKDGSDDKLASITIDYCQLIIKFYDPTSKSDFLKNTIKAFEYAIEQKVDIINYSAGGTDPSEEERKAVIKALDAGIIVVAAAGNEKSDLSKQGYYPALYDSRIIVVGNLESSKQIAKSSNFGTRVNDWEIGTNILGKLRDGNYGYMTGTSQAAAIKTGNLIRQMVSKRNQVYSLRGRMKVIPMEF